MEAFPPPSKPGASKKPEKAFSCVRCFDRKVKCTKQIPCPACTRAGVECVFRQPAAPRRRKKKSQEELLLARLRRCEDILKIHGINLDSSQDIESGVKQDLEQVKYETSLGSKQLSRDESAMKEENSGTSIGSTGAHMKESGKLVVEQGGMKYFDNNLYSGLDEELHGNDDIFDPSSEDESEAVNGFANSPNSVDFLLGISPTSAPLTALHPPPELIYKLWQVFLDNVNPLTKIIHQPTLQNAIFDASFNLENLPKGLEALMFSIYASAVYSMTDKECKDMLHEEKSNLLARYRLGLRKALVRANFLATSELAVLQAYVIYLLPMRLLYDPSTMWVLAGVASRLAQSLGLHRDGSTLGLSVFDTEMRRRLWWQIIILDGRSAELSGSKRAFELRGWNSKVPTNVNDSDLYPQMMEEPAAAVGKATEMISCCVRYELGECLRQSQALSQNGFDGDWQLTSPNVNIKQKDELINELEKRFEEKYVRYCDASIPIHFHTLIVARAIISSMRLMAHHPRYRSHKERAQSNEELDAVFSLALKVMECDNICHSTPVFRGFLWHSHMYFQWQGFIYLVGALRTRTEGPKVDTAWQQIGQTYEHHPTFLSDAKRPLHFAAGSLCLKAWQAREAAMARQGMASFPPSTPAFIQVLRQQRSKHALAATQPPLADSTTNMFTSNDQNPGGLFSVPTNMNMDISADGDFDTTMLADFSMDDISPMNWDDWDALVDGYGTNQLQDWTNVPGLSS
jgi:hypothetical protein